MQCPICGATARRFGRDRHGQQRYQCLTCPRTFTVPPPRPLDRIRLPIGRAVQCLRLLLEGTSVRSAEQLTEVHRDRIISALVTSGEHCQRFLELVLRDVPVNDVQADAMWGFIGCKERVRERNNYAESFGDAYWGRLLLHGHRS